MPPLRARPGAGQCGGPGSDRVPLLLCVTLDMLLLFPEPQFSQLYNGRVRENQRDMRTEIGEGGVGGWAENLREVEAETQRWRLRPCFHFG